MRLYQHDLDYQSPERRRCSTNQFFLTGTRVYTSETYFFRYRTSVEKLILRGVELIKPISNITCNLNNCRPNFGIIGESAQQQWNEERRNKLYTSRSPLPVMISTVMVEAKPTMASRPSHTAAAFLCLLLFSHLIPTDLGLCSQFLR